MEIVERVELLTVSDVNVKCRLCSKTNTHVTILPVTYMTGSELMIKQMAGENCLYSGRGLNLCRVSFIYYI